jgi:putative ABC transport system substrate-binding protein
MKRRELITLLGVATASAVSWPLVARAQNSGKRRLIAVVGGASGDSARPQADAIVQGMRDLGYEEGSDYEIRYHWANGDMRRLPALVQDAIGLKPDAILAVPTPAAVVAKAATSIIPIVCFMLADEVRLGLVANDARPGGNVTGLAMRVDGMAAKQVELALEIIPSTRKVGILVNVASADAATQLRDVEAASAALKVEHVVAEVREPADLPSALQVLAAQSVASIVVLYDALFFQERRRIASLVAATRLPAIYGARDHVIDGGLMSYGVSLRASAYRTAYYFDRIFKGTKAGDLPVEFPTKLELVINLNSAKALGIDVPPTLLALADEVIE